MNELDPLIRRVAEIYKFDIEFDTVLNYWIIKKEWSKYAFSTAFFYWNSERNTFDQFFDELQRFFETVGEERYKQY